MLGNNVSKDFNIVYDKLKEKSIKIINDINIKSKYGGDIRYKEYKVIMIFLNYLTYIKDSVYIYNDIKSLHSISNFLNRI